MKKTLARSFLGLLVIFVFVATFGMSAKAATINKKRITIKIKQYDQLKVTGTKKKIKWSSSDKKIVSVNGKGKIRGKRVGKAVVTAKYGKKKLSCEVYVREPMKYYAHRGYKGAFPENTIIAFNGAMRAGFAGVELDIFETKSGDIMVFHDDTLERLCRKNVSIYNVSKKNRNKYKIIDGINIAKYGSQLIPTFEETVKAMKNKNAFLYIHLKGLSKYTDQGISKIYRTLKKYDMIDQSIIFAGRASAVSKFRARGLQVGVNMTTVSKKSVMKHIEDCIKADIKTFIIFYPDKVNQKIVDKCHENGIQIGIYSVQTKKDAARLERLGVDFVFSNHALFR